MSERSERIMSMPAAAATLNPPWSLRRRVIALCLLLAVVLAFLAAGATATAVANRGRLDDLLDDVGPLRTASNDLLSALVNQETALRGYVLTASPRDLAAYQAGVAAEQVQTTAITTSPAANEAVKAKLAIVTSDVDSWRTAVAEPVIAAVASGDASAAARFIDDSARERFDRVRRDITALQQATQTVREEAVRAVRDAGTTTLFALITVTVLVLAGAIALVVALQRTVIGPVTHLAAQVRAVSRGDYDRPIATAGPPELANLGRDVDRMRRQIAADLAVVDTARRQLEQTAVVLEQQAAELARSNRDLEQFAYVASHDLQEPLRKVSSFCQLLQRRYEGQLDERADEYIAFAVSGAQRMQRLINDLLAFSRIGRQTSGYADVDLAQVVADAASVRVDPGELPDGGPRSTEPLKPEITWFDLPVVPGEEELLTTLFTNLIGNSVKFARPGVTPQVNISSRAVPGGWEISCVDNGIGIEPEYAEKVFVIFQRLHPRDSYPGTGIGLSVAKKIVEYHGGRIWVDHNYDGGTAIRFFLPSVAPADTAARTRELAA